MPRDSLPMRMAVGRQKSHSMTVVPAFALAPTIAAPASFSRSARAERSSTRNRHAIDGPGRRPGDGRGHAHLLPLGNEEGVEPETLGRADNGAEVLGVLDAVQNGVERHRRRLREEGVGVGVGERRHFRHVSLMFGVVADPPQAFGRLDFHRDVEGQCPLGRLVQFVRLQAVGEEQLENPPLADLEGLGDGVPPPEPAFLMTSEERLLWFAFPEFGHEGTIQVAADRSKAAHSCHNGGEGVKTCQSDSAGSGSGYVAKGRDRPENGSGGRRGAVSALCPGFWHPLC